MDNVILEWIENEFHPGTNWLLYRRRNGRILDLAASILLSKRDYAWYVYGRCGGNGHTGHAFSRENAKRDALEFIAERDRREAETPKYQMSFIELMNQGENHAKH